MFPFSFVDLAHVVVPGASVVGMRGVLGSVTPLVVVPAESLADPAEAREIGVPPSFGIGRRLRERDLLLDCSVNGSHYMIQVVVDACFGLDGSLEKFGRWRTGNTMQQRRCSLSRLGSSYSYSLA